MGMETTGNSMNTIDITGYTDNAVDAILAVAADDHTFDFDALTCRELRELAEAYPDKDFTLWIRETARREARVRREAKSGDYHAAIMKRQDQEAVNDA
jgi:hypothetical protein